MHTRVLNEAIFGGTTIMQAFFALLAIPFMLLNMLGGIASGIWLAILGQWWALGLGLAGLFLSSTLIGFAMMPGLIFAAPAAMLIEKGKVLTAAPLIFLSQLYTYAVVVVWCGFVFGAFMASATPSSFWPLLIFSYGVATGPITYLAQREQQTGGGDAAGMTAVFTQLAYVVAALVRGLSSTSTFGVELVFCGIMLFGLLAQTGLAIGVMLEQKRPAFRG